MSKQKKKRNKPYTGSGAAATRSTVTRIEAANRNPAHQWWVDHKRVAKPVGIATLVALAVAVIIYELIRLSFGL